MDPCRKIMPRRAIFAENGCIWVGNSLGHFLDKMVQARRSQLFFLRCSRPEGPNYFFKDVPGPKVPIILMMVVMMLVVV